MSRYHKVKWGGLVFNVSPDGPRRPWLLRMLPYQTGDQARLRVEIKGKDETPAQKAFCLAIHRSDSQDPIDYLEDTEFDEATKPILHFLSHDLPNSGEYTITLIVKEQTNTPRLYREIYQKLGGTVQVKTNLSVIGLFYTIGVSGITLSIAWLATR